MSPAELFPKGLHRGPQGEGTSVNPVALESTLTCPECGFPKTETMPTDACQWFYECTQCHALLRPKAGDCCVYCSYASQPCPPIQQRGARGGCCN